MIWIILELEHDEMTSRGCEFEPQSGHIVLSLLLVNNVIKKPAKQLPQEENLVRFHSKKF